MKHPAPLISATVIKRYKRFLVDLTLDDGTEVTAHCPNSGSMKTCIEPGWKALLSKSNNPKRKLAYTLECTHNGSSWIGVNTHRTNAIAEEGILNGLIPELAHYNSLRKEVKYGSNSRIDLLLEDPQLPPCYVEVKSVTLKGEGTELLFPDAVTTRGQKHIQDLVNEKKKGHRAVLLFIAQRGDGTLFSPAKDIDPKYAELLTEALREGLEVLVYDTEITSEEITVRKKLQYAGESVLTS